MEKPFIVIIIITVSVCMCTCAHVHGVQDGFMELVLSFHLYLGYGV